MFRPKVVADSVSLDKAIPPYGTRKRLRIIKRYTFCESEGNNTKCMRGCPVFVSSSLVGATKSYMTTGGILRRPVVEGTHGIPHYMPSGEYTLRYLFMKDQALNGSRKVFLDDDTESAPKIRLDTRNPDTKAPVIDTDNIQISAIQQILLIRMGKQFNDQI